jgi:hypothetical protein
LPRKPAAALRLNPPDLARAKRDAEAALDAIDWSKHDIVVWMPGTSDHVAKPDVAAALRKTWTAGEASVVTLDYVSSWELKSSASTAMATVRLFLLGAARRKKPGQRLLLAAESQGSWAVGENLRDPMLRRVVSRAALFGHPQLAATHFEDGHDPGVYEKNNPGDPVSVPLKGDPNDAMAAITALYTGQAGKHVGLLLKVIAQNPGVGLTILGNYMRELKILPPNPNDKHNYGQQFLDGMNFLKTGKRPTS